MRRSVIVGAFAVAMVTLSTQTVSAAAETIFDYIPSPLPNNVASYSYESWGVAEAGDQISFSTNGNQTLDNAKVVVSSWACENGTGWAAENAVPCTTTPGSDVRRPDHAEDLRPERRDERGRYDDTDVQYPVPPECERRMRADGQRSRVGRGLPAGPGPHHHVRSDRRGGTRPRSCTGSLGTPQASATTQSGTGPNAVPSSTPGVIPAC